MMMTIWYRHWLEIRRTLYVALIVTVVMILLYPFFVWSALSWLAETGQLAPELRDLEAIASPMPRSMMVPWGIYVQFLAFLTIILPSVLAGTSLSTPSSSGVMSPRHPSSFFTLSLPVPRATLVLTRLAAGLIAIAAIVFLFLLVYGVSLLVIGWPPSFTAVQFALAALPALRAVVVVAIALASLGLLSLLLREFWTGTIAAFAIFGGLFWWWPAIERFIAGAPWDHVTAAMVCAALLCAVSVAVARVREFQ